MELDRNSIVLKLPIPFRAWHSAFHWCKETFGTERDRWVALTVKANDPYVFVFQKPKDAVVFMINWNEWYKS